MPLVGCLHDGGPAGTDVGPNLPQHCQPPRSCLPPPCFLRGSPSVSGTKPSSLRLLSLPSLQAGGWGWRRRPGPHLGLALAFYSTQAWSNTPPTNPCP